MSSTAASSASRSGMPDGGRQVAGDGRDHEHHHAGRQPGEHQRPQPRVDGRLCDQHEVQPERHARADRQPGDLRGELVRCHVLVGRLAADQHDGDQRQHDADDGDCAGPLPQRHTDADGDARDEDRRQRRHHRDRARAQRGVEPPHPERLADTAQAAPEDAPASRSSPPTTAASPSSSTNATG